MTGTNSYRYPKGHQPAWAQDSKSAGNGGGGTGQSGGMTALSKSGKQPAPAPVIDTAVNDYPSLGAPAKPIKQVPSKNSKKSKSKKKGDGFLTLEDEPSPKESGKYRMLLRTEGIQCLCSFLGENAQSQHT